MESRPNLNELVDGGAYAPDAVDDELASLPDPPRAGKRATLALLAATALASLAMVGFLRADAAYSWAAMGTGTSGATANDLGDLGRVNAASFTANSYVHGAAMLGGAGAIRFERSFESDSFRVAPVAGRSDLWVELRVPEGVVSDRFVPPTSFQGRLVPFDSAGPRHRGLARAVGELTGQAVPKGAWLLVDGESPARAKWALALVAIFAGFALWNAIAIARLVRPVK